MRITLLTLGTRGDVQPYIALGLGLQQAGYSVTLGTSGDFRDMVTSCGITFAPFRFSIRAMLEDPKRVVPLSQNGPPFAWREEPVR